MLCDIRIIKFPNFAAGFRIYQLFYGILHRIISLFRQLPDTFALTTTVAKDRRKKQYVPIALFIPYDFNDMLNEKPFDMVKIIDHSELNEPKKLDKQNKKR